MRHISTLLVILGLTVTSAMGQETKPKESYELVYEIVASPEKKVAPAVDADLVAKKVRERLNLLLPPPQPSGLEGAATRFFRGLIPEGQEAFGECRIAVHDGNVEIHIGDADTEKIAKVKQIMEMPCVLEFRILANKHDHEKIIELAEAKVAPAEIVNPKDEKRVLAQWVKLDEAKFPKDERAGMILRVKNEKPEVLVVMDEFNVRGSHLDYARVGIDSGVGGPAVNFGFNDDGAKLFGDLTARNLPDPSLNLRRRLGMILDGALFSAPNLNSKIGAHGQITGHFTDEEVRTLTAKMKTGPLPASLKLVKEGKIELK